jgi:peptide/histidine transporter 3/4
VFIALISIEVDLWTALIPHFTDGESNEAQVNLIQLPCGVVIVILLLPLYKLFVYPYFRKYIPSMLKRIWIGAMLVTVCAGSILLIDAIGHAVNDAHGQVPCFLSDESDVNIRLKLNPYVVLIPYALYNSSYVIFTISLFEFIIAQSPHPMKGLLIGLYYSIRFGIGGCFTAINHYAFNFATSGHLISCGTANYIMITAISLLSLVAFTVVARQYKLRERDEVVNVHLFAEEYYTK